MNPKAKRFADRTRSVLETLRTQGPMTPLALSRATQIPRTSIDYIISQLELKEKVIVDKRPSGKTVRLPSQRGSSSSQIGSRRFANRRGQLGAEAPPELVKRALEVFESGVKVGPFGLADKLGCLPAEAIDAIAQLRAQGAVRNYWRDCFAAQVPHPPKKKAA